MRRILIYRLGSIGDFMVALPCFHMVRRRFPSAEIGLLTNTPVDGRAAPAASILAGTGLVDWYVTYPTGTRSLTDLIRIRREIRTHSPDLLVYIAAPRGIPPLIRDYSFFRWCGIHKIAGLPITRALRDCRPPRFPGGLWEREADRLGRCLAGLGEVDTNAPENWDLHLTPKEIAEADVALGETVSSVKPSRLIGLCIGTKQTVKDWGDENWRTVLMGLSKHAGGLVLIGAADERERSAAVANVWPGPVVNLCGRLSPRLSAAALMRVTLLLCNDSGPMHLAAAVGTRCVAVFSPKDPPGRWFPAGERHRILYPKAGSASIRSITPSEVISATEAMLVEA